VRSVVPYVVKEGSPRAVSTSTSTIAPSRPMTAQEWTFASTVLDRTVGEVKCRVRLSLGLTAGWGQGSGGSSRAGKLSAPMPTVSQVVKPPSENAMAQWAPGGSSKAGTRILSWLPSTLARN